MANPFIGEVRMFGGNFPPVGWATCDGQLLQISEYDTLFSLIGTTYGGDGQTNFALPNLAARIPIHVGSNGAGTHTLGQSSGTTSVSLNSNQIPSHVHSLQGTTTGGTTNNPNGNLLAGTGANSLYEVNTAGSAMAGGSLGNQGGSQPHDNMMPYLPITFIIALQGIYPPPP